MRQDQPHRTEATNFFLRKFLLIEHAISLALSLIRRSKEKNFIIFSDSMSSLEAISGFKLEIDIVHNYKGLH